MASSNKPASPTRKTDNSPLPGKPDDRRGAIVDKDLEMPHERDETTGMTGGEPSADIQQAHRDLQRGLQDTSKGAEMDKTYKKVQNLP